mmetsp:Transcript_46613/g.120700  ORF Transcript_46613/g.120700 Transcript_46613/m.120700 type:complete len:352 (+) Transcript_46613:685-1740(+)
MTEHLLMPGHGKRTEDVLLRRVVHPLDALLIAPELTHLVQACQVPLVLEHGEVVLLWRLQEVVLALTARLVQLVGLELRLPLRGPRHRGVDDDRLGALPVQVPEIQCGHGEGDVRGNEAVEVDLAAPVVAELPVRLLHDLLLQVLLQGPGELRKQHRVRDIVGCGILDLEEALRAGSTTRKSSPLDNALHGVVRGQGAGFVEGLRQPLDAISLRSHLLGGGRDLQSVELPSQPLRRVLLELLDVHLRLESIEVTCRRELQCNRLVRLQRPGHGPLVSRLGRRRRSRCCLSDLCTGVVFLLVLYHKLLAAGELDTHPSLLRSCASEQLILEAVTLQRQLADLGASGQALREG